MRRFVPDFATRTAPLTDLLRKNTHFVWTDTHEDAFRSLILDLATSTLLTTPKPDGPILFMTDASEKGIGAVLLQGQQEELVPIEYASRKLTEAEAKWSVHEREALAIKFACERWHHFAIGRRVVVLTDCSCLAFLRTAQRGRLARWMLFLQQYDLEIRHIAGNLNLIADWLSRCPQSDALTDDQIDVISPVFSAFPHPLLDNRLPRVAELTAEYFTCPESDLRETYSAPDKLRYSLRNNRLYIPDAFRPAIIHWFHFSRFGGHHGINRTTRRINRHCWWPRPSKSVAEYISKCLPCARYRTPNSRSLKGTLEKPLLFQLISLDCVGPRDWQGTKHWIIVAIDHHSRYMVTQTLQHSPNAAATQEFLEMFWLPYFGAPQAILTDRGTEFTSAAFRDYVLKSLQSAIIHTSPAYPQGNSINESSHRILQHTIAARSAHERSTGFAVLVRDATIAYNAAPHSATGQPPFFLLTGQDLVLPGLQDYTDPPSTDVRHACLREQRLRAYAETLNDESAFHEIAYSDVRPNDIILYKLPDFERARH
ncbi:MAG: DDE-type integrase/transposase/recombinase, partial [Planctomycetales bacterium]